MWIADDLVDGPIVPSSNLSLLLVMESPENMADILNIKLWTEDPVVIITNVSFHSSDKVISCYDLHSIYNTTENSSVQNFVMIHLKFVSFSTSNIIKLKFGINIVQEKMVFADTYVVYATTGNVTSEYRINMQIPEILNDKNNTFLRQFHKLLDGDNNTCVDLPVKGSFPPIFWTIIHTAWLKITASPFEITLVGKGVSCQKYGYKISQVIL
jgi:hypothetical protein